MKLLVGLGNPGAKYAGHRHNIGFMAIDAIEEHHRFSPSRSRFNGWLAGGRIASLKTLSLKPQTYMNRSGQSVGEAMRFFKLQPADVIILHDELDLAPGKMKVKVGGGHAGHNGLRSIHEHIGADYVRVRIGIGHPGTKDRVTGHVLSDFAKAEQPLFQTLCDAIARSADWLLTGEYPRFMTEVARLAPASAQSGKESPDHGL